jgi:hypothetical protein
MGTPGPDVIVGRNASDVIHGGGNDEDMASFIRFAPGLAAEIGGEARWANLVCTPSYIYNSVEAIEGSEAPLPEPAMDAASEIGPGHAWRNEPGVIHTIEALEDSVVIEVSTPELDDVVRLSDRYDRVSSQGASPPLGSECQ